MIRAKLLYSKPNKQGETVLYLGKGINRLEIVGMEGEEITIDRATEIVIDTIDEATKNLFAMILDFANRRYEQGKAEVEGKEGTEDVFVARVGATEITSLKVDKVIFQAATKPATDFLTMPSSDMGKILR